MSSLTQLHIARYFKQLQEKEEECEIIYICIFIYICVLNAPCSTPQGAAVLRMVSDFLSEPIFVQGLSVCRYIYSTLIVFRQKTVKELKYTHFLFRVISSISPTEAQLEMTYGDTFKW